LINCRAHLMEYFGQFFGFCLYVLKIRLHVLHPRKISWIIQTSMPTFYIIV
jgi:hypothetical protein